jgi:hypothetical protein
MPACKPWPACDRHCGDSAARVRSAVVHRAAAVPHHRENNHAVIRVPVNGQQRSFAGDAHGRPAAHHGLCLFVTQEMGRWGSWIA